MSFPAYLFWLWLLSALANLALIVVIIKRRQSRAWISLLLAAIVEVVTFSVLQRVNYQAYYVIWFTGAGIQAVLRVSVFYDILCAIPALGLMPGWVKALIGVTSVAAGAVVLFTVARAFHGGVVGLELRDNMMLLDGASKFAWAAFTVFLLYGIACTGFLMTMTGMRISTGYIIRVLVGMGTAVVYNQHPAFNIRFAMAGIDTAAGTWFALYCAYALLSDKDPMIISPEEASELDDLFSTTHHDSL